MVKEDIVLGHKISGKGIEVDKEKIETIEKLPSLTLMNGIRSFLGHAFFYKRIIRNFSIISKHLLSLLMQGVPFHLDECMLAFPHIKRISLPHQLS